jgi:hypothetical protein
MNSELHSYHMIPLGKLVVEGGRWMELAMGYVQ